MNFYSIVVRVTLLLIMAIPILRIPGGEHSALRNWASTILTVVLVVVFMVLSVDIVLWLVAQMVPSVYALLSLGHSLQESLLLPEQMQTAM